MTWPYCLRAMDCGIMYCKRRNRMRRVLIAMMAMSAFPAGFAAFETVNDLAPYPQSVDTTFWDTSSHPALTVHRGVSSAGSITLAGAVFKESAATGLEARHKTEDESNITYVKRTSPRGILINFR